MNNMSIRSLSYIILAIIAIYGVFVIYSAWTIWKNTGEAEQFWIEYQDISSARVSAYDSIVGALGYGEMIHEVKDYVLRKDEKSIARVRVATGKVIAATEKYTRTSISPAERSALRNIRDVVRTYAQKMEHGRKMADEGYSSRQIEKVMRVDDTPALSALGLLKKEVQAHRLQKEGVQSKNQLLGDIREALGFGGLIHNFKDYVLRRGDERAAKVESSLALVQGAVDKYRSFSLAPAEDLALKGLGEMIDSYKEKLVLAVKMAGEGKAPEEIDFNVKVDDNPALSALRILSIENSKQIDVSKAQTTDHLASSTGLSRNIMIASAIGSGLLLLLVAYVLFSHVLGPVNRITNTLSKFIEGDLDVEFYGTERKDELGYLARVIDKLRVILIGYALRQSGKS